MVAPAIGPFSKPIKPDADAFISNLKRQGTPKRVHNIELFLDWEVQEEIITRYDVLKGLDPADPNFHPKRQIAIQRFLGYDYVTWGLIDQDWGFKTLGTNDTAGLRRQSGRQFTNEQTGPITNWQEFEKYEWPDPEKADRSGLDFLEKSLPDDMCIIGGVTGHFLEHLSALMGYETLCYALVDDRDLVRAISEKVNAYFVRAIEITMQYERVEAIWGSDDLGFRTGTLISPDDLREFVLPGHRAAAKVTHEAGKLYLLHCCGQIADIMPDLIDDVKIDAKHSYEDTIVPVTEAKELWGDRIAILGGIDIDFLCRSTEEEVRKRVRETLDVCLPGGGYCLGTGNTVANYVPVDNYLAMLDEGRRYAA